MSFVCRRKFSFRITRGDGVLLGVDLLSGPICLPSFILEVRLSIRHRCEARTTTHLLRRHAIDATPSPHDIAR